MLLCEGEREDERETDEQREREGGGDREIERGREMFECIFLKQ